MTTMATVMTREREIERHMEVGTSDHGNPGPFHESSSAAKKKEATQQQRQHQNNEEGQSSAPSSDMPRALTKATIPLLVNTLDASDVVECYTLIRETSLHGVANSAIKVKKMALGFRYRPPGAASNHDKEPLEITLEYGPQRLGSTLEEDSMPYVQLDDQIPRVSWENIGTVYYTTQISSSKYKGAYYMASMTGTVLNKILMEALEYTVGKRRYQPFAVYSASNGRRRMAPSSSSDFTHYMWRHLSDLGVEVEPILNPPTYETRLWVNSITKVPHEPKVTQDAAYFYEHLYQCVDAIATGDYSRYNPTTTPTLSPQPTVVPSQHPSLFPTTMPTHPSMLLAPTATPTQLQSQQVGSPTSSPISPAAIAPTQSPHSSSSTPSSSSRSSLPSAMPNAGSDGSTNQNQNVNDDQNDGNEQGTGEPAIPTNSPSNIDNAVDNPAQGDGGGRYRQRRWRRHLDEAGGITIQTKDNSDIPTSSHRISQKDGMEQAELGNDQSSNSNKSLDEPSEANSPDIGDGDGDDGESSIRGDADGENRKHASGDNGNDLDGNDPDTDVGINSNLDTSIDNDEDLGQKTNEDANENADSDANVNIDMDTDEDEDEPPKSSAAPSPAPSEGKDGTTSGQRVKKAHEKADEAEINAQEAKQSAHTEGEMKTADAALAAADAAREVAAQAAMEGLLGGDGKTMASIVATCFSESKYQLSEIGQNGSISSIGFLYKNGNDYYRLNLTSPFIDVVQVEQKFGPSKSHKDAVGTVDAVDWVLALFVLGAVLLGFVILLQQMGCRINQTLWRYQRWYFQPKSAEGDESEDMFEDEEKILFQFGEDAIPLSMGGRRTTVSPISRFEDGHSDHGMAVLSNQLQHGLGLPSLNGNGGQRGASPVPMSSPANSSLGDVELRRLSSGKLRRMTSGSEASVESFIDELPLQADHDIPERFTRDPDLVDLPDLKSTTKVAVPVGMSSNGSLSDPDHHDLFDD